jgi:membrane protein
MASKSQSLERKTIFALQHYNLTIRRRASQVKSHSSGSEMFRAVREKIVSLFKDTAAAVSHGISSLHKRLERIPAFLLVERVILEFGADEATIRAGAISYFVLLSIFPLLLGLVSILGFFLPDAAVRQSVGDALRRALPGSYSFVEQTLDNVIQARGSTGIISLLLLIWSGSNLFGNVRRALNRAWDVQRARPFLLARAIDLGMVVLAGVLIIISVSTTTISQFFRQSSGLSVVYIGGKILAYLLAFGVFLLVYKYMPNTKTYWRWTWPGAFVMATFFQAGALAFVFYVDTFTNYQLIYGSLGSVIVLLFWIYLSAMIIILGAELNSELYRMANGIERGGTKRYR